MNVEIRTEAAQFLLWEYINGIFVAVYKPGRLGELRPVHWYDGVAARTQVGLRQSLQEDGKKKYRQSRPFEFLRFKL